MKYGIKAHWGNLTWLANTKLDQLVISLVLPLSSLGQYAVAVSVSSGLLPISGAYASVTFARVPTTPANEQSQLIFKGAMRAFTLAGIVAGFLAVTSPWLVPFVFGASFSPAVAPTIVLLIAAPLLGRNYVLSDGLRGLNHPARVAASETVGLLATAALLATLVPRFGVVGAAMSCLVAYFVIHFLLTAQLRAVTNKTRVAAGTAT